ncbi:MAG: SP_1767 family glycosyltransferase [Cetobacterium sp.]|uniref:SP_1767 family glycosyltransferase n=1 Tax=Cetobacterium sp. TaxID=2071632 RepID=UPI003EE670C5
MKANIWYNRYLILKDMFIKQKNKFLYFSDLKKIKVKNTDETLDEILKKKKSVIRLGDGELNLIFGENLKFQKYNEKISEELKEILKFKSDNLLVCLPNIFQNLDIYTDDAKFFWQQYLLRKADKILKVIDKNKIYYDTQISRFYMDIKDKSKVENRIQKILKIWESREVIIIEGEKSRLGVGNNLFKKTKKIERIVCPSHEAYSINEKILQESLKIDKNKLILLALGPTATILGFKLYRKGYQVIDIGHIDIEYEWYLRKSEKKEALKNKYIGEVSNLEEIEDIIDKNYQKQIICRILK